MKTRRHHNNKGNQQIKSGQTKKRADKLRKEICKKMCPNFKKMGIYACSDRTQCWEPCGDLGKDGNSAVNVEIEFLGKIDY